jgi:hypothetical protein
MTAVSIISPQFTDFLISIGFKNTNFILLAAAAKSALWTCDTVYDLTDSKVSLGEISLSFFISATFIFILNISLALSKYFSMNNMKITTIQTRIETAKNGLKANITQDANNQQRQPNQENILFLDKSSAYSDGSALFMIYESEVTSENSLITQ